MNVLSSEFTLRKNTGENSVYPSVYNKPTAETLLLIGCEGTQLGLAIRYPGFSIRYVYTENIEEKNCAYTSIYTE